MKLMAKTLYALALTCCLVASALAPAAASAAAKGKVLFVASNVLDMGDPEQHDARNNLWEYAPPFHIFVMHGYEVDFVSPQGGRVEFMMDPLDISSYAIKYENFLGKAGNTLKPSQIDVAQYQAENMETLADKDTVIVDQRIVSTMFLPSAALVAEEMVRLLERRDP